MQATTSGATHKRDILLDEGAALNFLESEKKIFKSLSSHKVTLYNQNTVVGDTALNYLNILVQSKLDQALKNIVVKEYYSCESIYPYLGDYFLFKLFSNPIKLKKAERFSMKKQADFISHIKSEHVESITSWIFENTNLKRSINIEYFLGKTITIETLDDFIFSCSYDYDFFNNLKDPIRNYRYVVINGIIESVSEIHHLLHKANESKEPYVIFCYGMSNEVKHTIIKNNSMGRLRVYPVCLDSNDENTLNILNDFAVIQGGTVVSSDMGQTISQEVSKELNTGKEIYFTPGKVMIKPNVGKIAIDTHINFLKKRIDDAMVASNVKLEPLQSRLKSFTSSRLNIYIPDLLKNDKKFLRELDYVLKFMSKLKLNHTHVAINQEVFYIPTDYIKISNEKLKSLKENFADIQAFIL